MVLVKIRVGISNVHGIGVFADQSIPKGTMTWRYEPWFDISYSEKDLQKMSRPAKKQVLWYAYLNKKTGRYVLCSDDYRFINHSENKARINIESTPDKDIAARDIKPGEELLCDYDKFDSTYFARLKIKKKNLN